jgi:hypothetical protein
MAFVNWSATQSGSTAMPVNREGESFLDALYGRNKGYVAVAAKNGAGGVWTEQVFSWPDDAPIVMDWAAANASGDVFICPALRRSPGRVKGDGAHLEWLWADVDYQDVPTDKRDLVRARIDKTATMLVKSGTGDNVHVYVRLKQPATIDIWKRLNAGLRAYLHADAKHTDNALLRLPGTINHKPGGKRVHIIVPHNGRTAKASKLLAHPVWQQVVITDDKGVNDGAFDLVDVTGLMRGQVKRLVTMDVQEACARYGTRHGAVYQVAMRLSKKGFTADQIHSLMNDFPAGVDKEETERGYSRHVDIARCLSSNPTIESLEIVEDTTESLEEASDDEPDDDLMSAAKKRVRSMDVESLARQIVSQRAFMPPPDDVSYRWSVHTSTPRQPVQFAVDGIAAVGQNVTITGQYKSGKTLLGINLIRCLVDGDPFLGEFKVPRMVGEDAVGFWSLEMSKQDLDGYIDPIGLDAGDRLVVLSGRGYGVNLLTDVGKAWAINWLRNNGVCTWVIDSHARVCRMAGVDENDNGQVLGLLHRLDEIKEQAGLGELYYLAHTGRGEQTEGRERARGATVLDDWADSRWVLTRDGNLRFLAVEGRTVQDMEATSLIWDKETGRLALGTTGKHGAKNDGLVDLINALVMEQPGDLNKRGLKKLVAERAPAGMKNGVMISDAIAEAVECGFIEARRVGAQEVRYHPVLSGGGGARPIVIPAESDRDRLRRERRDGRGVRRKKSRENDDENDT